MHYKVTDLDGNPVALPTFTFQYRHSDGTADQLTMILDSEELGMEIEVDLIFQAFLAQYPTSTPAIFPFKLVYRECLPIAFSAPFISN